MLAVLQLVRTESRRALSGMCVSSKVRSICSASFEDLLLLLATLKCFFPPFCKDVWKDMSASASFRRSGAGHYKFKRNTKQQEK